MAKKKNVLIIIGIVVVGLILLTSLVSYSDEISALFAEKEKPEQQNNTQPSTGKPPVASLMVSRTRVEVGIAVLFDANESYDPDYVEDGTDYKGIVSYIWDYSIPDMDPEFGNTTQRQQSFPETGDYTVTLTVVDESEMTDSISVVITVVNQGTTVSLGSTVMIGEPIYEPIGVIGNSTEVNWTVKKDATQMNLTIAINGYDFRNQHPSTVEILLYNPYEKLLNNATISLIGGQTVEWSFGPGEIDVVGDYYLYIQCMEGAAMVSLDGYVNYL
ncbi:MAG: PKD domain-containing protein [Thermoplasmata archaeon]|nr:PKD domain-containing protein [Thermoplasmata archaeon]